MYLCEKYEKFVNAHLTSMCLIDMYALYSLRHRYGAI